MTTSYQQRTIQRAQRGFTLIELVVTMAIIALLASIAIPSYRQHVIRGKRAAAQSEMLDLANREQQYLMANRVYATDETLVADGYVLPPEVSENYNWNINVPVLTDDAPVPTFTITFTPKGAQASDATLTLNNVGTKTPADKWKR